MGSFAPLEDTVHGVCIYVSLWLGVIIGLISVIFNIDINICVFLLMMCPAIFVIPYLEKGNRVGKIIQNIHVKYKAEGHIWVLWGIIVYVLPFIALCGVIFTKAVFLQR